MADDSQSGARTMRAWRTHEYGAPLDALHLDAVEVPVPDAGEVRVEVQAIPLNLNDLERITGGNMMVEPQLPYSPGMEVMGIVDACGGKYLLGICGTNDAEFGLRVHFALHPGPCYQSCVILHTDMCVK